MGLIVVSVPAGGVVPLSGFDQQAKPAGTTPVRLRAGPFRPRGVGSVGEIKLPEKRDLASPHPIFSHPQGSKVAGEKISERRTPTVEQLNIPERET